jgi:hypothetical protein
MTAEIKNNIEQQSPGTLLRRVGRLSFGGKGGSKKEVNFAKQINQHGN